MKLCEYEADLVALTEWVGHIVISWVRGSNIAAELLKYSMVVR